MGENLKCFFHWNFQTDEKDSILFDVFTFHYVIIKLKKIQTISRTLELFPVLILLHFKKNSPYSFRFDQTNFQSDQLQKMFEPLLVNSCTLLICFRLIYALQLRTFRFYKQFFLSKQRCENEDKKRSEEVQSWWISASASRNVATSCFHSSGKEKSGNSSKGTEDNKWKMLNIATWTWKRWKKNQYRMKESVRGWNPIDFHYYKKLHYIFFQLQF